MTDIVEKVALAIDESLTSETSKDKGMIDSRNIAKAAIEAHTGALAEAGMVIVPREPLETASFELMGIDADLENGDPFDDVCKRTLKRAMSLLSKAMIAAKESGT